MFETLYPTQTILEHYLLPKREVVDRSYCFKAGHPGIAELAKNAPWGPVKRLCERFPERAQCAWFEVDAAGGEPGIWVSPRKGVSGVEVAGDAIDAMFEDQRDRAFFSGCCEELYRSVPERLRGPEFVRQVGWMFERGEMRLIVAPKPPILDLISSVRWPSSYFDHNLFIWTLSRALQVPYWVMVQIACNPFASHGPWLDGVELHFLGNPDLFPAHLSHVLGVDLYGMEWAKLKVTLEGLVIKGYEKTKETK